MERHENLLLKCLYVGRIPFGVSNMKPTRLLQAAFDLAVEGLAAFGALLIFSIMLFVSIDVVMRYFFNSPIFWVDELAEYALLYITFTGAAWVLRKERHVKVDILYSMVSGKSMRKMEILSGLFGIFICAVLTYTGVVVAWDHYQRKIFNPTLLSFPKWVLLAVIPVGTFLLLVIFIGKTMGLLRHQKEA